MWIGSVSHIALSADFSCVFLSLQPTDITEPNPVALLLLCVHLYQRLPQYLPRSTVHFHGPLHGSVTNHVSGIKTKEQIKYLNFKNYVLLVSQGKVTRRYCAHPRPHPPTPVPTPPMRFEFYSCHFAHNNRTLVPLPAALCAMA